MAPPGPGGDPDLPVGVYPPLGSRDKARRINTFNCSCLGNYISSEVLFSYTYIHIHMYVSEGKTQKTIYGPLSGGGVLVKPHEPLSKNIFFHQGKNGRKNKNHPGLGGYLSGSRLPRKYKIVCFSKSPAKITFMWKKY